MSHNKSNYTLGVCLGTGIGSAIGALVPVIFNVTGIMAALTNFIPPSAFIAMCICSFAMFGLLLGWLCPFILAQKWKDRDFVMNAVQQGGWALEYASDDLKNDLEVVLAAAAEWCGA